MTSLTVLLLAVAVAALIAARLRRPTTPQCVVELDTPYGVFTSTPINAPMLEPSPGDTLTVIVNADSPTEVDTILTGHRAYGTELVVLARASAHALSPLGAETSIKAALSGPWPANQPFLWQVSR